MQSDRPYLTPLKKIAHPKGQLMHALKQSDAGFVEFGEAYFTSVHMGDIKGWKKHLRMQLNLIVPVGEVCFSIHNDQSHVTSRFILGENNYARLTVPPGHWVAFAGVGPGLNLILNVASIEHDPAEALNAELARYPLEESK